MAAIPVLCKPVNNIKVHPVPQVDAHNADPRPVKGEAFLGHWNFAPNVFCLARKRLGKTSVVMRLIKECALKGYTSIIVFCPTFDKDPNYAWLREFCESQKMPLLNFSGIKDDGGVNNLVDVMSALIAQPKDEWEADDAIEGAGETPAQDLQANYFVQLDTLKDQADVKEKKKKRPKIKAAKYIVVFDDCSNELRHETISKFVKIAGSHLNAITILSSQWCHDLSPACWRQLDFILCFKALVEEKLQLVYKNADLHIPYELFVRLYKDATDGDYHFLLIDVNRGLFKRDFSHVYEFNADDTISNPCQHGASRLEPRSGDSTVRPPAQ